VKGGDPVTAPAVESPLSRPRLVADQAAWHEHVNA
jgi:hypothetical protein